MATSFPLTRHTAIVGAVGAALAALMISELACAFGPTLAPDYGDPIAPNTTEERIRRNYSNNNIRAKLGGNFRRLLAQVWG